MRVAGLSRHPGYKVVGRKRITLPIACLTTPNAPALRSFEVTETCLLGPDSPRMQASLGLQSCIRIIHQRTCRLGRGLRPKEIPGSFVMIDNSGVLHPGNKKRKNLVTTEIAQFIIFIVAPKQDCKHYCSTIYVHIYEYTYIYVYIHIGASVAGRQIIGVVVVVYADIYIYIYIYMHIYTHIYTY